MWHLTGIIDACNKNIISFVGSVSPCLNVGNAMTLVSNFREIIVLLVMMSKTGCLVLDKLNPIDAENTLNFVIQSTSTSI